MDFGEVFCFWVKSISKSCENHLFVYIICKTTKNQMIFDTKEKNMDNSTYQNPLTGRYAGKEIVCGLAPALTHAHIHDIV